MRQEPDTVLANELAALVSRPVILKALFGGQSGLPNVDARQIWIMVWIRGSELRLVKNRIVELNNVDNVMKIRHHRASRSGRPSYTFVHPTCGPALPLAGSGLSLGQVKGMVRWSWYSEDIINRCLPSIYQASLLHWHYQDSTPMIFCSSQLQVPCPHSTYMLLPDYHRHLRIGGSFRRSS